MPSQPSLHLRAQIWWRTRKAGAHDTPTGPHPSTSMRKYRIAAPICPYDRIVSRSPSCIVLHDQAQLTASSYPTSRLWRGARDARLRPSPPAAAAAGAPAGEKVAPGVTFVTRDRRNRSVRGARPPMARARTAVWPWEVVVGRWWPSRGAGRTSGRRRLVGDWVSSVCGPTSL